MKCVDSTFDTVCYEDGGYQGLPKEWSFHWIIFEKFHPNIQLGSGQGSEEPRTSQRWRSGSTARVCFVLSDTHSAPKIDCFYLTLLTVLLSPLFNSHSVWFFSYLPLTARIDRLALVDGLSFTLTWTYAHQWCGYVRPCQGVIPACVYNLIVK